MKNYIKTASTGFSLVELMIVIVIIGILAAIGVAGFLASKRSANEGSVISALRLVHGAQMTYASSYGAGEYAGDIGAGTVTSMSVLHTTGMIDDVLGSGTKSGFNYVGGREAAAPTSPAQFFFSAVPISIDPITRTGNHRFGIGTEGVMKYDETLTAQFADVNAVAAAPPFSN